MSNDLRQLARGRPCMLRLPGCLPGNDTVVLAHIRRGGIAGTGQKPNHLAAMPMCDHCHSKFDGRVPSPHSRAQMDADALRGLLQWHDHLLREGVIQL